LINSVLYLTREKDGLILRSDIEKIFYDIKTELCRAGKRDWVLPAQAQEGGGYGVGGRSRSFGDAETLRGFGRTNVRHSGLTRLCESTSVRYPAVGGLATEQ